jgi:hypothetical protein
MKKIVAVAAFAALTVGAATAFAGALPQQGVNGSSHDIIYKSGAGYYKDDFGRVCIYCHTPHNAQPVNPLEPLPLWNRYDPKAVFTPYAWAAPANVAAGLASDPLVGPSRLCLSCHDGVTAVDSHGPDKGTAQGLKASTGTVIQQSTGRAWADLSGTHPIGFSYADAVTARTTAELIDPSTGAEYLSGLPAAGTWDTVTRAGAAYSGKKISDTLYNGILTCASCHDVHNTRNAHNTYTDATYSLNNGVTEPNYFVWAPEQGSMLCLSCHVK